MIFQSVSLWLVFPIYCGADAAHNLPQPCLSLHGYKGEIPKHHNFQGCALGLILPVLRRFKMSRNRFRTLLPGLLVICIALAYFVLPVAGQPPSNDDRSSPTLINALPFAEVLDTFEATQGYDDPNVYCDYYYGTPVATVWYSYTAANAGAVVASTAGSDYNTVLAIFDQYGGQINCRADGSPLTLSLNASEEYTIMVGAMDSGSYPGPGSGAGGSLSFSLEAVAGPANDAFAEAAGFAEIPYQNVVDLSAASIEPGEPQPSCTYEQPSYTIWYAFTPATSGSYSVE
jgi:hypothetical protein